MKSIKFTICIVLLVSCLLLIPKHPANANPVKDRDAIFEVIQQFIDAFEVGDGAAVGELYTEDAMLFAPNFTPIIGQTAIGSFFNSSPLSE